jgi:adenylate cyclase class 2
MPEPYQETEVKFYVRSLEGLRQRIVSAGGLAGAPRTHELNLRFDTAQRDLLRAGRVLRLRRDPAVRLTYKEDRRLEHGATTRTEIEVTMSDFAAAQQMLAALGYSVIFVYEKYRSAYRLGDAEVMLDELPFGDFVEIEGALESLMPTARNLGLSWTAAIPISYHALFESLRRIRGLQFRDLTFENLKGTAVQPADLGVLPADE